MFGKKLCIKIDLQLHAITCPGVWLCTHGYLEITIKTLGYYFRTGAMEPQFPLLCHDRFTIEGYFKSISSIEELATVLAAEQMEITLWQCGRRLAYFVGSFSDILQAKTDESIRTDTHDFDVELLMKTTTAFPGIIAPKVELSTKVAVQNRSSGSVNTSAGSLSSKDDCGMSDIKFRIPTVGQRGRHCSKEREADNSSIGDINTGCCFDYLERRQRQRPVCHTKMASCSRSSGSSSFSQAEKTTLNLKTFKDRERRKGNHEQRRLSTDSSKLSTNSFTPSQEMSRSGSQSSSFRNVCGHSSSLNRTKIDWNRTTDEHQQNCQICRLYRQIFS